MTAPRAPTSGPVAWLACRLVLGLLLVGCASTPVAPLLHAVGQADPQRPGAVVDASAEQALQGLHIERAGQRQPAAVGMALAVGDVVESGPHTLAVIRFPEGHELTLLPLTRVQLGSAWLERGEIYVRQFQDLIKQLQGQFKVKTRYVTAGVEGTVFWARLERGETLAVGVVEGRVSLASVQGLWLPVTLASSEVATVEREGPPSKDARQRAEVDRIVMLMRSALRPMPPRPPSAPLRP